MSPATPEPGAPVPLPSRGSLLGFDFGLARIGVAVGELETASASALELIASESNEARFARIAALIAEWRPVALVVGLPSHPDGSPHELSKRCRRFANQLHGRFGIPVALVDERFSSVEAEHQLAGAGHTRHHQRQSRLDAAAAQIILQQFLEEPRHAASQR